MMSIPTIKLSNGIEMPAIGIGTHQAQGEAASDSLALAFNEGYRLVDTAAAYLTEPVVREAIKKSDVKREDIFITSKLRNACHGYRNTMEAFEQTLENLGTDYLDLYLIHWPNPIQYRTIWQRATKDTWKAFVELYKSGRIRAIGVSNFMPHHIDMVAEDSGVIPMVNQLKLCPGVVQPEIVKYCKEKGILWFASCWDEASVDFMEKFDVHCHNVCDQIENEIKSSLGQVNTIIHAEPY